MTPSVSLLLFVAIFWTLPASLAVFVYRRNGNSLEQLKGSIRSSIQPVLNGIRSDEAKAGLDA